MELKLSDSFSAPMAYPLASTGKRCEIHLSVIDVTPTKRTSYDVCRRVVSLNEALADCRSRRNGGRYWLSRRCPHGHGDQLGNFVDDDRHSDFGNHLSGDLCDLVEMVARSHLEWSTVRWSYRWNIETAPSNPATGCIMKERPASQG